MDATSVMVVPEGPALGPCLGGTVPRASASGGCASGPSPGGLATEGVPDMSTPSRFLGVGVALGLAAGLLVGMGLTGPGRAAAAAPSTAPSVPSSGIAVGAPGALTPITMGGGAVTASGTAIAYPYPDGSSGVAPDHTIVITGVGQADLQSDGSDRAAAQKSALAAALADAKAQADVIASGTGLTISGVLSVSASASPGYGVMPLGANGAGTPTCVAPMPATGSGKAILPQPVCPPTYQQTLSASVTVEYSVR
jgi:Protein of unknown function (DUF541)